MRKLFIFCFTVTCEMFTFGVLGEDFSSLGTMQFYLSPMRTYLRYDTKEDRAEPPLTINLRDYGVRAGDVLKLKTSGFFNFYYPYNTFEDGSTVGGVFKDAYGIPLKTVGLKRTKDLYEWYTPPTCMGDDRKFPTDIPYDFEIPNISHYSLDYFAYAQIPVGAVDLEIGIIDCHYDDNMDLNGDFMSIVEFGIVKSKYKLVKEVKNLDVPEVDKNNVKIAPKNAYAYRSSDGDSVLTKYDKSITRKLIFTCLDEDDIPQDGCRVSLALQLKDGTEHNGGHDHYDSSRPLGTLSVNGVAVKGSRISDLQISKNGLEVEYLSPEVSGTVELIVHAFDKYRDKIVTGVANTNFSVRIKDDLVPINIPELATHGNTKIPNQSHPYDGFYLTKKAHEKLAKIVKRYIAESAVENIPIIKLRSTAASLKLGGLYDIALNWKKSHFEHRAGTHIDLSTHTVFGVNSTGDDLKSQKALKNSIVIGNLSYPNSFPFPDKKENPRTGHDHWHVYLNEVND